MAGREHVIEYKPYLLLEIVYTDDSLLTQTSVTSFQLLQSKVHNLLVNRGICWTARAGGSCREGDKG